MKRLRRVGCKLALNVKLDNGLNLDGHRVFVLALDFESKGLK